MKIDHSQLPPKAQFQSITKQLGAEHGPAQLYRAHTYLFEGVRVIELEYMDASRAFIKFTPRGSVEISGTHEVGTGELVTW